MAVVPGGVKAHEIGWYSLFCSDYMDLASLQGFSEQSKESEQVSSLAPQLLVSLCCHLVR